MRRPLLAALAMLAGVGPAAAQNTTTSNPPSVIGNRANGRNYQPTPNEVAPRERQAGIAPPAQQQQQTNKELFQLDAKSLKAAGQSTNSVPNPQNPH